MTKILKYLGGVLETNHSKIYDWLANEYAKYPPCFYSSVDIRHSGNKVVPVDTNLFPAGFNNFDSGALQIASQNANSFFKKNYPSAKKILIIPENHTRNSFYLENVLTLSNLIKNTLDKEVKIGLFVKEEEEQADSKFEVLPLIRKDNIIICGKDFIPDLIILNNDLSAGIPDDLLNLDIPIIPAMNLGWHMRSKANHFTKYQIVAEKFASEFNIDPFLITTKFKECGMVNFKDRAGVECVANHVENLIADLKILYEKYEIKDDPYVFIKADKGTYGMGIMTAKTGEDVLEMNKKTRNKMHVIKNGVLNTGVIIQEGVKTIDQIDENAAEPLIYSIDSKPFGITYRVHDSKDAFGNLNSQGMYFKKIPVDLRQKLPTNIAVFYLIAQLASIASAME